MLKFNIDVFNAVVLLEADPTTLYIWSAAKVGGGGGGGGRGQKSTKKAGKFWVGFNSPTGHDTYRLYWI